MNMQRLFVDEGNQAASELGRESSHTLRTPGGGNGEKRVIECKGSNQPIADILGVGIITALQQDTFGSCRLETNTSLLMTVDMHPHSLSGPL